MNFFSQLEQLRCGEDGCGQHLAETQPKWRLLLALSAERACVTQPAPHRRRLRDVINSLLFQRADQPADKSAPALRLTLGAITLKVKTRLLEFGFKDESAKPRRQGPELPFTMDQ